MGVDFVDEFIEVVLVSLAEVDEGLDCLVGVGGDVLLTAFVDDLVLLVGVGVGGRTYLDHVVDEDREVGDAVVDVRRLVYPDQRFVEDRKEVSE